MDDAAKHERSVRLKPDQRDRSVRLQPDQYTREIESYLCKKNGGHLIRIVGPAFEQVRGWAEQGIPLKIAFRGIDRCCDRHAARGSRRRPLRIEFCEADVLDAFDDWRRAIGTDSDRVRERSSSSRGPLAAHIERVVSRLLALRVDALGPAIAEAVEVLDGLAKIARRARGDARAEIIQRLADLDTKLLNAVQEGVDPATADSLRADADADLAPFAARMTEEARKRASTLAYERLLRESLNLPVITYE